jgi:AraC-like DNA-binding protein
LQKENETLQKTDGDIMSEKFNYVKLNLNPWPEFFASSYRYFFKNEKHITRICDFYVLIFMLDRTLLFTEDGATIELKKGEWYLQTPDLLQQGVTGSPAPAYFYIHFNAAGERLNDPNYPFIRSREEKKAICLPKRGFFDIKLMKPLFDQLNYCYINKSSDLISQQSIFLTILDNISVHKEEENGLANQICRYISENYNKDISCEILAEQFHFSTEYITKRLKQYCGQTPGQYLKQIRIARAKELLSNTDHTLMNITSEVGYHDPTVFYKAFKKETGMSPGGWRERSRGIVKYHTYFTNASFHF